MQPRPPGPTEAGQIRAPHSVELETEIGKDIEFYRRHGNRAEYILAGLSWLAIIGSVGATLSGLFTNVPKPLISILAALPTMAILIHGQLKLQERAVWHNTYARKLNVLRRRLVHEIQPIHVIITEVEKLDEDMDRIYPKLEFSFGAKQHQTQRDKGPTDPHGES